MKLFINATDAEALINEGISLAGSVVCTTTPGVTVDGPEFERQVKEWRKPRLPPRMYLVPKDSEEPKK